MNLFLSALSGLSTTNIYKSAGSLISPEKFTYQTLTNYIFIWSIHVFKLETFYGQNKIINTSVYEKALNWSDFKELTPVEAPGLWL